MRKNKNVDKLSKKCKKRVLNTCYSFFVTQVLENSPYYVRISTRYQLIYKQRGLTCSQKTKAV